MAVKILTIHDIGPEKWDAFVKSHPHGSLYHTSAWHGAIEDSYGYKTRYYVIHDSEGAIRSALPAVNLRNLFLGPRNACYPFSDYCDPLAANNEDLLDLVNCLAESPEPFEIRTNHLVWPIEDVTADDSFFNYSIPLLDEPEELYSRLHPSCIQRKIRKSEKSGVKIREGSGLQDLRKFYQLHLATRRRLGLPAQPFCFFRKLWENFGDSGKMKLLFAEYEGRQIGCLVLIGFRSAAASSGESDILYYKYGASDSRYFGLGFNPALFWRAILLARDQGYSCIDLGRASGTDEVSLGIFKEHLGAEKKPLLYYSTLKAYSETGKSGKAAMAGKVLRLAPCWVSRMAGRLFYRYLG
jgi:lipid II:glycine glycyltransferase (peptidoglycan interpeptide bridge formation enzyme)